MNEEKMKEEFEFCEKCGESKVVYRLLEYPNGQQEEVRIPKLCKCEKEALNLWIQNTLIYSSAMARGEVEALDVF